MGGQQEQGCCDLELLTEAAADYHEGMWHCHLRCQRDRPPAGPATTACSVPILLTIGSQLQAQLQSLEAPATVKQTLLGILISQTTALNLD